MKLNEAMVLLEVGSIGEIDSSILKSKYRLAMKKYHPDALGGDEEKCKRIIEAKGVLEEFIESREKEKAKRGNRSSKDSKGSGNFYSAYRGENLDNTFENIRAKYAKHHNNEREQKVSITLEQLNEIYDGKEVDANGVKINRASLSSVGSIGINYSIKYEDNSDIGTLYVDKNSSDRYQVTIVIPSSSDTVDFELKIADKKIKSSINRMSILNLKIGSVHLKVTLDKA